MSQKVSDRVFDNRKHSAQKTILEHFDIFTTNDGNTLKFHTKELDFEDMKCLARLRNIKSMNTKRSGTGLTVIIVVSDQVSD